MMASFGAGEEVDERKLVLIEGNVQDWLDGKRKGKLPGSACMSKYIKKSEEVKCVTDILLSDDRYEKIRSRCNDHLHQNCYHHVLSNDSTMAFRRRCEFLDSFRCDVRDLLILHLAYLFYMNGHYMMADDHRDSLDLGLQPEPDSEHWVAPFIQAIFDGYITPHRSEIAELLRRHAGMHLE